VPLLKGQDQPKMSNWYLVSVDIVGFRRIHLWTKVGAQLVSKKIKINPAGS
jgi:hypothetical protein